MHAGRNSELVAPESDGHYPAAGLDGEANSMLASTSTSVSRLEGLASARDPAIRAEVAENSDTPAKVLAELASDVDETVRYMVGRNEAAPAAVLDLLASDAAVVVRAGVAQNESIPVAVLRRLTSDTSQLVRTRAAANPVQLLAGSENDAERAPDEPVLPPGITPLMHWAGGAEESKVRALLEGGADVNAVDHDGDGVLSYAMSGRSMRIVELLLEAGADPNAASSSVIPGDRSSVLHVAASHGASEIILALIAHGANIDAKGGADGATPLMSAAASGQYTSVVELVSAGAGIDIVDGEGDTALYYAASKGNTSVVELLLDAGADPNHPAGMSEVSPLLFAARAHLSTFTKQPVPRGKSIDDFMDIVMVLLRAGANPSQIYDRNFSLVRDTDRGLHIIQSQRLREFLGYDDLSLVLIDPRAFRE